MWMPCKHCEKVDEGELSEAIEKSFKEHFEKQQSCFMTQLRGGPGGGAADRTGDEEEVNSFPVVKESAGKLIETGINTLQKTLLLKREVEVDTVHAELQEKRAEFKRRMEICTERQIEIQKKQQKMKDRVTKFEKFIKENEAKRRRAIQKYQNEVKLREQKSTECTMLSEELEKVTSRHEYLEDLITKYKKYEEYLLKVLENLPENYLEINDSMLTSLMMRHRTLSATNQNLVTNLTTMADSLEGLRQELDEMREEHNKRKVTINSKLSQMQKLQEDRIDTNQEMEALFALESGDLRSKRTELGRTLMAIDNIAEKCRRKLDKSLDRMSLEQKLDVIKEYLCEKSDIVRIANPEVPRAGSPTSDSRRIGKAGARKTKSILKQRPDYM